MAETSEARVCYTCGGLLSGAWVERGGKAFCGIECDKWEASRRVTQEGKPVLTAQDIMALTAGNHRCGWTAGPVKNPDPECGCFCGTVYAPDGHPIISHYGRGGPKCRHADERGMLKLPTPDPSAAKPLTPDRPKDAFDFLPPLGDRSHHFTTEQVMEAIGPDAGDYVRGNIERHLHLMTSGERYTLYRAIKSLSGNRPEGEAKVSDALEESFPEFWSGFGKRMEAAGDSAEVIAQTAWHAAKAGK